MQSNAQGYMPYLEAGDESVQSAGINYRLRQIWRVFRYCPKHESGRLFVKSAHAHEDDKGPCGGRGREGFSDILCIYTTSYMIKISLLYSEVTA